MRAVARRGPRRRRLGLTRQRFEALVAAALDDLPPWVQERLENVEVLIEDEPPEEDPELLGLYEGIPLTERGSDYAGVLPDRITLFRRPIEEEAEDEEDLKEVVRETVVHEVAHFFGISDERLHELGWS
ncbi:MAG TPA: metallopeptidase family protein [Actinomycetota bacterium]|nr:metallopeptidase family protein [Actinomycetota bacterium]